MLVKRHDCWNRKSTPSYTAQDGWRLTLDETGGLTRVAVMREFANVFHASVCQYGARADDPRCQGCREQGY